MRRCVNVLRGRKSPRLLLGESAFRGLEAVLRDANAISLGGDRLGLVGARAIARDHCHACVAAKVQRRRGR
jgi:hypothetical protein